MQIRKNPYDDFSWEKVSHFTDFNNCTLRTKPSEPVWEYQWLYKHNSISETYITTQYFMTDKEAEDDLSNEFHFLKIQETKRERKQ